MRVAIVKTAGDKFFCAGWDLKAAAGGDAVDGDYGVGGFAGLQELRDLNKPVIACVNGMAVGGGFELALSCDLIYASDHSSFALPEIRAGTLADAATIKLPKRIPYHVAMDLLLTGRWMDVAEAHRWGLVNEVLPKEKLEDRVWEIARLLAGGPPLVFAAIKETARVAEALTFQDAMNKRDAPPAADGRCPLRLRGQYGRLSRVCRKARAGVEGECCRRWRSHPLACRHLPRRGEIGLASQFQREALRNANLPLAGEMPAGRGGCQAIQAMTDYKNLIDAETWAFIERTNSYYPPDTIDYTIAQQREIYDRMCREFFAGYPEGVTAKPPPLPRPRTTSRSASTARRRRKQRRWCFISMAAVSSSAGSTAMTMSAPSFAPAPAMRWSRSTTGWRRNTFIRPPSTMR